MPAMYDSASFLAVPIGSVLPLPATGIPAGYLLCDGSAISKTTYADLFAVIGTRHGEPVVSGANFNIPDYRGRFLRGADNATGRDPDSAGRTAMNANGSTGSQIGTLQSHGVQNHSHGVIDAGHNHGINDPTHAHTLHYPAAPGGATQIQIVLGDGSGLGMSDITGYAATGVSVQGALTSISIGNHTGNTSTESRPVNAYTNYIIRFQ
jgi:microcystin-dependent protein